MNSDINNAEIQLENSEKINKINLKNKKEILDSSLSQNSNKEIPIIKPESNKTENLENMNAFMPSSINNENIDNIDDIIEENNDDDVGVIDNIKNQNGNELSNNENNVEY